MQGVITALWKNRITGAHVALLLVLAILGVVTRAFIIAPAFRDAVGFIPFDLQPHLNREMLIIQLGAIVLGKLADAYLWFALADTFIALVIAAFFASLWQWLFANAPNWLFGFVRGGGIILLPVTGAMLEIVEHVAVFHLLGSYAGGDSIQVIEFTTTLHNVKIAVLELRNGLTAVFLAIAGGLWLLRRRKTPGG